MIQFKKLTTNLPAGTNTYTFTDALINDASVIEVYTDNDDVYPVNLEQHGQSIEIELSDHAESVNVALTINNVVTYEPTDISGLENEIQSVSDNLSGLASVVNEISDNVDNIEGDVSTLGTMVTELETNKQDVLTAGENITIDNNVISASRSNQEIYDNTEIVIGSWFGKPLYRKVLTITKNITVFADQWTNIYDNVGNIKIISGKFLNTSNNGYLGAIWYRPNNNNLEIYYKFNIGAGAVYNANVILEYTKVGE